MYIIIVFSIIWNADMQGIKAYNEFSIIYVTEQWRSMQFKMREDDFLFMSIALFLLQHVG
jgi:hypothetical protein